MAQAKTGTAKVPDSSAHTASRQRLRFRREHSKQPSLKDIEHVVLLTQENRSFDHYFGTFPGVRGFGDPRIINQGPNGLVPNKSVLYQYFPSNSYVTENPDGYLLPYHLDTLKTGAQAIPSTSHSWDPQHTALNNGRNDNWLTAHLAADHANAPWVMGYYEQQDIPFQRVLAEAFTLADNSYCGVLGPTHPNRYTWMTGNIDPTGQAGGPALDNNITNGAYTWRTYAENLTDTGVSWKCYQESDNYGTNVLATSPSTRPTCPPPARPSPPPRSTRSRPTPTCGRRPRSCWSTTRTTASSTTFRFSTHAQPPVLPDTSGPLTVATLTSTFPLPPFPGADQTPPKQPPGKRPHVG